ncbi:single-stranded DNA-binding protein [Burkholderia ubonensis]|uniref:Single-stranded DNA-binding protein n=1 Tax=Burkholderia ubonensis TaxID=101571 RepID=A0ABD4DUK8_9BURK|nr:single-stranded DNA-binding protein [Burkholderia ubonensis]KVP51496.1 single-stranded DNA-binding protein [Burkholderia ubonensis]KVX59581.1 single-stranded DNA-binding protein [Burkholderia ubonensis]KVZ56069.1 single-stranded DNA-binding protein [Burkholderia ubonensis]KVZ81059.1 single-stranded DNA-binding protein [Burkholderia ubonensis]
MTDIRQYVLTHDFSYEIVVEIAHDVLTDERLCELVRFWGDGESRIEQHGALTAFLKLFAARFMTESVISTSPQDAFNEGRIDGFPAVDGSSGLRVVDYDEFSFKADDIDVLEI